MSNAAYSPIQHLAHALFLNHDPKKALMVMLTAYFDASQSQQGSQVMTMAGFVSSVDKWAQFETEWNDVLKRYGVPYLHMNEFNGSTEAFKGWKNRADRDELKKHIIIDLIKVAKKRVYKGFSSSLLLSDYQEVNRDFKLGEQWGCEYSLVGMRVVTAVMEWKKKHFPDATIKYIFEDGDTGNEHLKRCLNWERLPYAFTPHQESQDGVDKYIVPFQMADFAAWEQRAAYERMCEGRYDNSYSDDPLKLLRQSFQALYRQIPAQWDVLTEQGLRILCESRNLKRNLPSSSLDPAFCNHPSSNV